MLLQKIVASYNTTLPTHVRQTFGRIRPRDYAIARLLSMKDTMVYIESKLHGLNGL